MVEHPRTYLDLQSAHIVHGDDQPSWRRIDKEHPGGWFVYTVFEAQLRVAPPLYVGLTSQLCTRLSHHKRHRAWWPLAGGIVVEPFPNRADASEAEDRRIYALAPLFNTVGNIHRPPLEVADAP